MTFLEKDLEEIIHTTDRKILEEKGLFLEGIMKRQLKIGHYGVADLVTFSRDYYCQYDPCNIKGKENLYIGYLEPKLVVTIYELKKEKISVSAFMQCVKYAKGLKSWFNERGFSHRLDINLVLIGKTIDLEGSTCFLPDIFEGKLKFYIYYMDIEGLHFKSKYGYGLINEGF